MFHDSSFQSLSQFFKGNNGYFLFVIIGKSQGFHELILLTLEISQGVKLVLPYSYQRKIARVTYIPALHILLTLKISKGLQLVCFYSYGGFSRMKSRYFLILIMGKFQVFHDSSFRYLAQMLTLGIFLG